MRWIIKVHIDGKYSYRSIPVELYFHHVWRKEFCLDDVQLHVACPEADDLVQGVDDAGAHKEHPEPAAEKKRLLSTRPQASIGWSQKVYL